MWFLYIVATCFWGCVWGIVTNNVIKNKGYYENWFWWGFFFGFFALIVALTKPEYRNSEELEHNKYQSNWVCDCGRTNPSYTGTCVCGRSKDGSIERSTITNTSYLESAANQFELERKQAENAKILHNGGWRCYGCNTANASYIGFCACGMSRGQSKEIEKQRMNKQFSNNGEANKQKQENDKFDEIKKYKELLEEDIITKEEFEKKKAEILRL